MLTGPLLFSLHRTQFLLPLRPSLQVIMFQWCSTAAVRPVGSCAAQPECGAGVEGCGAPDCSDADCTDGSVWDYDVWDFAGVLDCDAGDLLCVSEDCGVWDFAGVSDLLGVPDSLSFVRLSTYWTGPAILIKLSIIFKVPFPKVL